MQQRQRQQISTAQNKHATDVACPPSPVAGWEGFRLYRKKTTGYTIMQITSSCHAADT